MQTISANLNAALIAIDARLVPRDLIDLFELYANDYVPGVNGFVSADAIETFASESITWNGIAYRRELRGKQDGGPRSDIVRNMGEKTNSVTLNFSNISRYMATLAQSQEIEGMYLVIRCVVPSVTDDSLVLFVGRCDKPSDIDKAKFTLTARQDFGNVNQEIPPRLFIPADPTGRTPSDPLYEGFRLTPLTGFNPVQVTVPSTSFFGRLFGRTKKKIEYRQWSSVDETPYGSEVPMIFGRCQMELVPILFADIGNALIGVWIVGEGRIDDFTNVKVRDSRLTIATIEYHYGDPGGTGSNATNTSGPINQGYLSNTAYVVLSLWGSTVEQQDDTPLATALVKGMRVPLPNTSGVYGTAGWTDNPVHIARFILTDSRLVRINSAFMEDAVNYQTALHCDEPIFDDSNGELTLIPAAESAQAGVGFTRYQGTGILNARFFRYYYLGDTSVVPEYAEAVYTTFSVSNIPNTFPVTRILRKRYTASVPITEKVRAVDFLYKVLFPAAKLFIRVNKRGKYEILSEKSADATFVTGTSGVGATSIAVRDVTPWMTGALLQGWIHIGFGLTTSENRQLSSAEYSGGGAPFSASATGGGVTATASGATLSGGSTTVPASGTVTIGGTPAAGNTATITIDGIAITHNLSSIDTTGTVAGMLASSINAHWRLNKYIKAEWSSTSPTIVTIKAKHGILHFSQPLLKPHIAVIGEPGSTPSLTSAAGALAAGTYYLAYTDVTQLQAAPLVLGATALSPIASIVLTANRQINVGAIALVGVSRNWYMSDAANSPYLKFVANTNGSAFSINALPLPGAALAPLYNRSGEEVIRIAMPFSTNSQDIFAVWPRSTLVVLNDIYLPSIPNGHRYKVTTGGTTGTTEPSWPITAGATVASGTAVFTEDGSTVLQQSGLTRANIKKDSFKWPLGSRQSSINQIKISYRDANNDFAKTPYTVNDRAHQAQVNKIYPLEVDGAAIDNFHQMFRIANWQLAKNREGDWFDSLATGPQGMILEEGDVISASDDSGGLVNVITRIEEIRIHPNHDVTIGQARRYSTNMFSDEVGADDIPVPTVLKYVATRPSIVEFLDGPPIRDADALVAAFYLIVSFDLVVEGDWRGWVLWADYGDGYLAIASGDLPAVMGIATTTLGTVVDSSVFDRVNSLTFTLKYEPNNAPFATVTEEALRSNPRRNLFLVGNEYLQAATIVSNGNHSYTISTLLRGRFGTDGTHLTHGASERVALLDGSEGVIRIDPARLNNAHNYKIVTTNQDLADATAIPFTWTGGTIKPLSPINLRGSRDSLGNLLIQWTHRSRMSPGLRSSTEVPLGEEIEQYDLEVLNMSNVVLRTTRLYSGGAQAALLIGTVNPSYISGNDISGPTTTDASVHAYSKQQIRGTGGFVEATLRTGPVDSTAWIGLLDAGRAPFYATTQPEGGFQTKVVFNRFSGAGVPQGITVYEQGVQVYTSGGLGSVTEVRIRILVSGGELRYYWDYTGPGSIPFYISPLSPLLLPAVAIADVIYPNARVEGVIIGLTGDEPSTILSVDQQVELFGSVQGSIRNRIYQISSIVGRGPYVQGDL